MQRDPTLWENPEGFDPSRWAAVLQGQAGGYMSVLSGMGPNDAYLPFGAGPRNCIGTGMPY